MTDQILDSDPSAAKSAKRPIVITVICVLALLGSLLNIPMIFSESASSIASWYPVYLAATSVLTLVCVAGLWKMKKWAAYLYIAGQLAGIAVFANLEMFEMYMVVGSLIMIVIVLTQLKKMN